MKKDNFFYKILPQHSSVDSAVCIGVWILVFQNCCSGSRVKDVYVVGGEIETEVTNSVDVY